MDMYGLSTTPPPDFFRIDDLLDFSNEEMFSSSASTSASSAAPTTSAAAANSAYQFHHPASNAYLADSYHFSAPFNPTLSADFTTDLYVPNDDAAELEWLSRFVDDSFSDVPAATLAGTLAIREDTTFAGRAHAKRSRVPSAAEAVPPTAGKFKSREKTGSAEGVRRCSHCASEKTPQWRTGPLGPKTLCNACGVRYKSGRLVPEYRPAASPTFVLTQHSNSHRKVLELRRQKELQRQQQQNSQEEPQHQRHLLYPSHQVC